MSEDEQYRIIGRVVSDHEEANKYLAALKAKAQGMGEVLEHAAAAVQGRSSVRPSADLRTVEPAGSEPHHVPATIPTREQIIDDIQEIATVTKAIRDLEVR